MPKAPYKVCKREDCDKRVEGRRPQALYCSTKCQEHGLRAARRAARRAALRCNHCDRRLDAGHSGAKFCKDRPCRERARYLREGERAKARNLEVKLRKLYGLTVEEYNAMLESQHGTCAICGGACSTGRRLAVDHCHDTGAVRGLLCRPCNQGLGQFADDPGRMRRAADYLEGNTYD